jgi:UDP-glucose 4-epimerase
MIAVTGADGLVGREVCGFLCQQGHEVVPVIRCWQSWSSRNSVICSSEESEGWDHLAKLPILQIVHLAAAVPHSAHYTDDEASASLTMKIDRQVHMLAEHKAARVIYMSTCGLYQKCDPTFKDETAEVHPTTPYFRAKLEGERLMLKKPNRLVFRLSAPIGPGMQPSLVVARLLKTAQEGGELEVWGTGRREQDFIDVRDCATAITKAVGAKHRGILNLASGRPVTMEALARTIVSIVGRGGFRITGHIDPKEGETARYRIDATMAALAWSPAHNLHDSLAWLLRIDPRVPQ